MKVLRPGAVWLLAGGLAAMSALTLGGLLLRPRRVSPPPAVRPERNLNRLAAPELAAVPGIGPALAERIVSARAQRGGFKSWEELLEVPGVGPGKLERLRQGWDGSGLTLDRAETSGADPKKGEGMKP